MDNTYSQFDDLISVEYEQFSTSNDEYSNDTTPSTHDVESRNSSKVEKQRNGERTYVQHYGPIVIRKRQSTAPTLATGRRPKNVKYEGDEAIKRDIRRMKNRESAKNLKKLRDDIAHNLESTIDELELEERELSTAVNVLRSYKTYLERRCEESSSKQNPASPTIIVPSLQTNTMQLDDDQHYHVEFKEERTSPSPPYQLAFCI
ncbi:unnamed protein product [Adineta ricciae]|uniref:BZIP domain-containing protein n=1 Tax=Adineta ricciae TaxID=249248 RepID=A0A814VLF4_ADIRI|nr:unnamed protein product [Adineta ricciae]CAF1190471.1 unnamed protein product [Adineta ricciae]